MPDTMRGFFERRIGADFGSVSIHDNAEAHSLSRSLGARAFTVGSDIYFAAGEYAPGTRSGTHLLAHELTHTVQQSGGTSSRMVQRVPDDPQPDGDPARTTPAGGDDEGPSVVVSVTATAREVHQPTEALIKTIQTAFNIPRGRAIRLIEEDQWEWIDASYTGPSKPGEFRVGIKESVYYRTKDKLYGLGEDREKDGSRKGAGQRRDAYSQDGSAQKQVEKEFERRYGNVSSRSGKNGAKDPAAEKRMKEDILDDILLEREQREAFKSFKPEVLALFGDPSKYVGYDASRIRQLADTLNELSDEDLAMFGAVIKGTTSDLDQFERALNGFVSFRDKIRQLMSKPSQPTAPAPEEPTLDEKLNDIWEGTDLDAMVGKSENEKRAFAEQKAAEHAQAILKHQLTHPLETAQGMARGLYPDQLIEELKKDVAQVADGNENGFARWAAAFGGVSKISGWIAGLAGALYVALYFVPGVNLALLATTAIVAGGIFLVASMVENKLNIEAAVNETDSQKFKRDIIKAGTASANLGMFVALIALGFVFKLIGGLKLPGGRGTISEVVNSYKFRVARLTGGGPALLRMRGEILESLASERAQLEPRLNEGLVEMQKGTNTLSAMPPEELVRRILAGDATIGELIPGDMAEAIKALVTDPETAARIAPDLKAALLEARARGAQQAREHVTRLQSRYDEVIGSVKKAQTVEQLQTTMDLARRVLNTEALAEIANGRFQKEVRTEPAQENPPEDGQPRITMNAILTAEQIKRLLERQINPVVIDEYLSSPEKPLYGVKVPEVAVEYAMKFKEIDAAITEERIVALLKQGADPYAVQRIIQAGGDPSLTIWLAEQYGIPALKIAELLISRGIPGNDARATANSAGKVGQLYIVQGLLEQPGLRNPKDLQPFLSKIAKGDRGDIQTLRDANERVQKGNEVSLNEDVRDLTDYSAEEWVEHKDVSGTSQWAFYNNLADAAAQLRGKTTPGSPKPAPATFKRVITIRIADQSHPFYNFTEPQILEVLRTAYEPQKLAGVDIIRVNFAHERAGASGAVGRRYEFGIDQIK